MKLSQLLEAERKHQFAIFTWSSGGQIMLEMTDSVEDMAEMVNGEAVDVKNIIVKVLKVGENVWQMDGGPGELEVNHDEGSDLTVFQVKNGKVVKDNYGIKNAVGHMIDTDNPEAAALAKKLADRKAKK